MSKYLISLKPLEPYFFGNERGFDNKNKEVPKEEVKKTTRNYLVKSNKYPQQTSILGMLRKEILVNQDLLNIDWNYTQEQREKMNTLIGKYGFNINEDNQNFGVIKSISQLFITKKVNEGLEFYITSPKDHNPSENIDKYTPYKLKSIDNGRTNNGINYILEDYNPKNDLADEIMNIGILKDNRIQSSTEEGKIIKSGDIFTSSERVGITKNKEGKKEEDGFYKITHFNLEKGYEFSFIADIEDEKINGLDGRTNIVSLGGLQSSFRILFKKVNKDLNKDIENRITDICKKSSNNQNDLYKIILTSDSYINLEKYMNLDLTIAYTVDFRYMVTKKLKDNKKIYPNDRFKKIPYKYTFIQRGSVLYTNNISEFETEINKYKSLIKIGYNKFIVVTA